MSREEELGGATDFCGDGVTGGLTKRENRIGEGLGLRESQEEHGLAGCYKRRVLLWGYMSYSNSMEEIA